MATGGGPVALHEARGELARLFEDLWALGKPTVARVRGYALAGGFGLALACDLVVAADDAVFGTPEVDVGLWPFMITVPADPGDAAQGGARADADRPAGRPPTRRSRLGFVNRVVPVAGLDAAVDELAATLAAKPPDAVRVGLASFHEVWGRPADEALRLLHPLLSVAGRRRRGGRGPGRLRREAPAPLERASGRPG